LLILFGWVLVGFLLIELAVVSAAALFLVVLFAFALVLMVFLAVIVLLIFYGIISTIMFSIFVLFFSSPLWLTLLWIMFLFGVAAFLMLGAIGIPLAYFLP
jgi:hypothetical protein